MTASPMRLLFANFCDQVVYAVKHACRNERGLQVLLPLSSSSSPPHLFGIRQFLKSVLRPFKVITAMPKQNGKHQPDGSPTPQRPRKEGVSSPYFAKPVTSPYFDKAGKPDKSSQSRVESSDVSVKRHSKIKSTVSKQVGDQVESVSIQPGVGAGEGTKPKRKRSKASSTPSVTGLRLVLRNTHSDRSVPMAYRILAVKPRLIQGQWI
jgi:hypothetical protein